MNQRGFNSILFFIIIAAVLVAGYFAYNRTNKTTSTEPPKQVACTQEAKLCPDGTSVGRVGPKCDFAPCPTPKESTNSATINEWKNFKRLNYEFDYPNTWKVTTTDYANTTQITNESKTIAINISIGQYPYGFEGPGYSFGHPLVVVINNQEINTEETIVGNKKAYVDFQIGNSQYYVLFGTGYPAAEDRLASLSDYYQNKDLILKILSTFKFVK